MAGLTIRWGPHQGPPVRHPVRDDVQETPNGCPQEEGEETKKSNDDYLDSTEEKFGMAESARVDAEAVISQLWQRRTGCGWVLRATIQVVGEA